MKVLPTLYIQQGRVVSVLGEPTVSVSPMDLVASLAERYVRFAFIDVDAARGTGHNRELIAGLMKRLRQSRSKMCIQVGGGIRSSDLAQFFLDQGATWLLVGTVLHRSPVMLDQLLARFRDHLTASMDVRKGEVLASGWTRSLDLKAEAVASKVQETGFRRILFTDVPSELGEAPDFDTAHAVGNAARLPLFMAGSIRTREHMHRAASVACLQGFLIDAMEVDSVGEAPVAAVSREA